MRIVHAAAECLPYAKTGGLADMVGSLTTALADNGHDVSVFIPGYRTVFEHPDTKPTVRLLSLENDGVEVRAFSPRKNLTVHLLCNTMFFDRTGMYGADGHDFDDNHQRFMFFSRGVVEALRLLNLKADVVHCHDWQTAMLPMMLRCAERRHSVTLAQKTVFTIHNMAFQGTFPIQPFDHVDLPDDVFGSEGIEYYGQINMMKGGLIFADRVTTVSPRYASEIRTQAFGCGLDGVIAHRADRLVGLLNGIDPAVWDPTTDVHLSAHYSAADVRGKHACRKRLLKVLSLDAEFAGPIFGMICRLTEQKGLDLLLANLDMFLGESRLVILGTGEHHYEDALRYLATTAPDRISFMNLFDEAMSHLVEAGSDFFLMPSIFEPCGLNQMYSQVYGAVPLASQVGGLFDTVTDVDEDPTAGTGLTFPPTAAGFRDGLVRAKRLFADKPRFCATQRRGMQQDFSWAKAVTAYERLYRDSLGDTLHGANMTSLSTQSCTPLAMVA